MIKKIIIAVALLMTGCLSSFSQKDMGFSQIEIVLQVRFSDVTKGLGERPRNPICPPSASLDDHTLFVEDENSVYTLYIVDYSGDTPNVLYQTVTITGTNEIDLPATLTGNYDLILVPETGDYYFYSEIEL